MLKTISFFPPRGEEGYLLSHYNITTRAPCLHLIKFVFIAHKKSIKIIFFIALIKNLFLSSSSIIFFLAFTFIHSANNLILCKCACRLLCSKKALFQRKPVKVLFIVSLGRCKQAAAAKKYHCWEDKFPFN